MIVQHLPKEVFPEYFIIRVNAYDKIPDTPLEEWMTYLKTGDIKEDTCTPGLQQAREKLRVLSMTKAEREAYFRHLDNIMVQNDAFDTARYEGREEGLAEGRAEGRAEGLVEGRAEGLVEGRAEEKLTIAKNLLSAGMPINLISSCTGLPEAEIASLNSQPS